MRRRRDESRQDSGSRLSGQQKRKRQSVRMNWNAAASERFHDRRICPGREIFTDSRTPRTERNSGGNSGPHRVMFSPSSPFAIVCVFCGQLPNTGRIASSSSIFSFGFLHAFARFSQHVDDIARLLYAIESNPPLPLPKEKGASWMRPWKLTEPRTEFRGQSGYLCPLRRRGPGRGATPTP
jgi:hypothetical protein